MSKSISVVLAFALVTYGIRGFAEANHFWSKSAFINHLNDNKRQSVESFNTSIDAIKESLQKTGLDRNELKMLDAWAKKLLFSQESFLKRVQQFKADASPEEIKNLKHDKLIGMYQARISELESVLNQIEEHVNKINQE